MLSQMLSTCTTALDLLPVQMASKEWPSKSPVNLAKRLWSKLQQQRQLQRNHCSNSSENCRLGIRLVCLGHPNFPYACWSRCRVFKKTVCCSIGASVVSECRCMQTPQRIALHITRSGLLSLQVFGASFERSTVLV